MKVAILSDVHGNVDALKAVLKDIAQVDVAKIYVLGDLAFCGPYPKATIDFIRDNLSDQVLIQGNTDEMIVKATGEEGDIYTPKLKVMANALFFAQNMLEDEDKEFLANLKPSHYEDYEGLKMLFVHGSPRKNDEGITVDIKYSKLDEMMKGTDAHLVFCGHTHYPIMHQSSGKTVVNVGSVGRPFGENPRAVYALLDLSRVKEREFDIEHRYVPYDVEPVAAALAHCDFEGSEILAEMLMLATDKFPSPYDLN